MRLDMVELISERTLNKNKITKNKGTIEEIEKKIEELQIEVNDLKKGNELKM